MAKKSQKTDPTAEPILRRNLLRLADGYCKATNLALSSVSRYAHGDVNFLKNIKAGKISFTARKYDLMVGYFREKWPPEVPFPELEDVPCPRL